MTQHTPGPWRVRRRTPDDTGFVEADKIDPKMPYNIEILGDDETGYPTKAADVDFIVLACNSHDALLEALTKIAYAPEGAYSRDKEQYLKNVIAWCQETARAAIAQAEPKEGA